MTTPPRLTFLVDVDNTLLDNDAAKVELDRRLRGLLGEQETERFWRLYEEVREEAGVVSYPLTLARFHEETGLDEPAARDDAAQRELRFALADLTVAFPYADFLYPGVFEALVHLRSLGRVVILSDGDPAHQPSKIARAGLDAAVDGFVLVYPHKEEHLREATASFPADRYVLIEDKPDNIAKVRANLNAPFTGVLVRQGKYAAAVGAGSWASAEFTLERISEIIGLDREALLSPAHPVAAPSASWRHASSGST